MQDGTPKYTACEVQDAGNHFAETFRLDNVTAKCLGEVLTPERESRVPGRLREKLCINVSIFLEGGSDPSTVILSEVRKVRAAGGGAGGGPGGAVLPPVPLPSHIPLPPPAPGGRGRMTSVVPRPPPPPPRPAEKGPPNPRDGPILGDAPRLDTPWLGGVLRRIEKAKQHQGHHGFVNIDPAALEQHRTLASRQVFAGRNIFAAFPVLPPVDARVVVQLEVAGRNCEPVIAHEKYRASHMRWLDGWAWGKVISWDEQKGCGFIMPEDVDPGSNVDTCFFHFNALTGGGNDCQFVESGRRVALKYQLRPDGSRLVKDKRYRAKQVDVHAEGRHRDGPSGDVPKGIEEGG
jgi:cold shock CspA family protein